MKRAMCGLLASFALLGGLLWWSAGRAGALLPARPAPCSWTFGSLSTEGALGTQVLQVRLNPASASMSCIQSVAMTSRITDAAGAVPAGIAKDGGTATVSLLFSAGEYPPPTVLVAWHAYCTTVPQPVFLHLIGAGMAPVYPLGQSNPCARGPAPTSNVDPPLVVAPDPAVGLAPVAGGGYRIAVAGGGVLQQPGAVSEAGNRAATPFAGIATDPKGGFWLVSADGGVYSYNGAGFFGSAFGARLAGPVVGMASTPTGLGYWLVAADGGVFAYGDARFSGSAAGAKLAAPVVGIAASPDGKGYWLAGADGGVFNYGDARFSGSAGSARLVAPVVGIAGDGTTGGYWLVAGDGGVFGFDAPFFGSAGGTRLDAPVTGMAPTATADGYWLVSGDGGVFTYGRAAYHGTAAGLVYP